MRAGVTRLSRRFHAPTGLDDGTAVWLAIDDIQSAATLTLNERLLGQIDSRSARFEITDLLATNNLLVIEMSKPPAAFGSVRLEIEQRYGA